MDRESYKRINIERFNVFSICKETPIFWKTFLKNDIWHNNNDKTPILVVNDEIMGE